MVITTELTRELLQLEELVVDFVLPQAAKTQYQQGKVSKKELAPFVETISAISRQYLAKGQVKLSTVILSSPQIAAYALYYLPINFAKLSFLLRQNLSFPKDKKIRVLDFGCGPGTGALAAASCFGKAAEISLSDASPACLQFASQLVAGYRSDISTSQLKRNSITTNSFDLVIAANVLTELSESERAETLSQLTRSVAPDGYLLLLEPALKISTQLLMKDRDNILAKHHELAVIFPCTRQSPCPMLIESQDDWCHGELTAEYWERPPLLKQLDELLEFNKHRVKYAAQIFQRAPQPANYGSRLLRPLSKKHPALLCGTQGLVRIEARGARDSKLRRALKNGNSYGLIGD